MPTLRPATKLCPLTVQMPIGFGDCGREPLSPVPIPLNVRIPADTPEGWEEQAAVKAFRDALQRVLLDE
jgi:hypothetical protein